MHIYAQHTVKYENRVLTVDRVLRNIVQGGRRRHTQKSKKLPPDIIFWKISLRASMRIPKVWKKVPQDDRVMRHFMRRVMRRFMRRVMLHVMQRVMQCVMQHVM